MAVVAEVGQGGGRLSVRFSNQLMKLLIILVIWFCTGVQRMEQPRRL